LPSASSGKVTLFLRMKLSALSGVAAVYEKTVMIERTSGPSSLCHLTRLGNTGTHDSQPGIV